MTAARSRTAFGLLTAALAVLLYCFGTAYLLWLLLALLGVCIVNVALIRADAGRLRLQAEMRSRTEEGQPVRLILQASRKGRWLAAGHVTAEVELHNVMFDRTRRESLRLRLDGQSSAMDMPLELELCGEIELKCVRAQVWDGLGVFSAVCAPFQSVRTVCYPKRRDLELKLSRDTAGMVKEEGMMQNRRGGDPSEIFDIREYAPGDDVRAIHWKLSSKTDTLMLKEASEPLHYDVVLLPDLGFAQLDAGVSYQELNSAAAVTVELGEQLLRRGADFCLAIPGKKGLQLCEIRDARELRRVTAMWLGMTIPPESGIGFGVFLSEHLEQYFTRLLLISAGQYVQDIGKLGRRIGITVVSTSDRVAEPSYTRLETGAEIAVLPSEARSGGHYKVIC